MPILKIILISCLFLSATLAKAEVIRFGIQSGYAYSSNDNFTSDSDRLGVGEGVSHGVFTLVPILVPGIYAKLGINRKNSSNDDYRFSRSLVDALLVTQAGWFTIGAGFTYHMNINLENRNTSTTKDIHNAAGFVLEGSYRLSNRLRLGVRSTGIEYDINGTAYDGSNGALTVSIIF